MTNTVTWNVADLEIALQRALANIERAKARMIPAFDNCYPGGVDHARLEKMRKAHFDIAQAAGELQGAVLNMTDAARILAHLADI
jgi:hypothetical protein